MVIGDRNWAMRLQERLEVSRIWLREGHEEYVFICSLNPLKLS